MATIFVYRLLIVLPTEPATACQELGLSSPTLAKSLVWIEPL